MRNNTFSAASVCGGLTLAQVIKFANGDLVDQMDVLKELRLRCHKQELAITWRDDDKSSSNCDLKVSSTSRRIQYHYHVAKSYVWSDLMFACDTSSKRFGFSDHEISFIPETSSHRQHRLRKLLASGKTEEEFQEHSHTERQPVIRHCEPTTLPHWLVMPRVAKAAATPREVYFNDQTAQHKWHLDTLGSARNFNFLNHGEACSTTREMVARGRKSMADVGGLSGLGVDWSGISVPDKELLIADSGKLKVLDSLLTRLKEEGHRVLIYSQMTRMIDLLEEFMFFRKHKYMRLDGSSRINDRRDMIADFQAKTDIFVFLLSTRAGGLGINLTAADTVIFYDSDWNPTVDQQAMDRAHRLGQTKQVTVYRLICKGSIEERILQRAQEKSEIQRMVIAGGSLKPDTLKPTEVVSLLLDDEELEQKFKQRQIERKAQLDEARKRDPDQPTPKRKYTRKIKKETSFDEEDPDDNGPEEESNADIESFPASPFSEVSSEFHFK